MSDDRTSYVGGPGAATILGLNPYQTPVELWQFLTKRSPPVEVNAEMRRGRLLERAVLDYCAEELGERVLPGPFVRDVKFEIAGGHLDGVTETTGNIVEGKTMRSRKGFGAEGTGEIPGHIAAQDMWYLGLVPEARICWTPVLFSGLEFEMYKIERNDQIIEQMKNVVWRWWRDYILTDTPPPPQTGADVLRLFPEDHGNIVIADDATAEAVARLRDVKREADLLEAEREQLESRIKLALADAAMLSLPDGEIAATWKTTKPSQRFDQAAFKTAEPGLYTEYCRTVTSRRFLLKSTGEWKS